MHKEDLYNELKRRIVSEEILPGTWLVEREICEKYQVSRTPVREILRVLAADGLIILEPGKGYVVRKLNFEELVELFHARESIEGMLARLACNRADEAFLDNIMTIRKQLEEIDIENDPSQGVDIGHLLHNTIVTKAKNRLLGGFYDKLNNLGLLTRNMTKVSVAIEQSSRKDHIAIADALLEKDENKSEHAMRRHIRSTCILLSQHYLMEQTGLVGNLNG